MRLSTDARDISYGSRFNSDVACSHRAARLNNHNANSASLAAAETPSDESGVSATCQPLMCTARPSLLDPEQCAGLVCHVDDVLQGFSTRIVSSATLEVTLSASGAA